MSFNDSFGPNNNIDEEENKNKHKYLTKFKIMI